MTFYEHLQPTVTVEVVENGPGYSVGLVEGMDFPVRLRQWHPLGQLVEMYVTPEIENFAFEQFKDFIDTEGGKDNMELTLASLPPFLQADLKAERKQLLEAKKITEDSKDYFGLLTVGLQKRLEEHALELKKPMVSGAGDEFPVHGLEAETTNQPRTESVSSKEEVTAVVEAFTRQSLRHGGGLKSSGIQTKEAQEHKAKSETDAVVAAFTARPKAP